MVSVHEDAVHQVVLILCREAFSPVREGRLRDRVLPNPPSLMALVREPHPPGLHTKDLRFYISKASLDVGVFMCVV
jgi:hypothetical protein